MGDTEKSVNGLDHLVPRVLAESAYAQGGRFGAAAGSRAWDETSFFRRVEAGGRPEDASIAREILEWARRHGAEVWWHRDAERGCFVPVLYHDARQYQLFAVWDAGSVEIYLLDGPDFRFYWYTYLPPFDRRDMRFQLLRRLNAVGTIALANRATSRRPRIDFAALRGATERRAFLGVLDWALAEIRAT